MPSTIQADLPTLGATRIRWGRIILAALVLEVVIAALTAIPPLWAEVRRHATVFSVYATTVGGIAGYFVSALAVRPLSSRLVLHSALIGIVATAMFLALCALTVSIPTVIAQYGAVDFYVGQSLRIIGCVVGGFVTARRRAA